MPRLSIVIPWMGPASALEETLAAVLAHRPGGSEVLVALAAPYDDPYELADEVTFVEPTSGAASLVALVNRGVTAASAPVVSVIPCGLQVTEDWTSAALLHFADPTIAAVAPAIVRDKQARRVIAAGIDFSAGGARKLRAKGRRHNVAELVQRMPLAAPLCGGFFRKRVLEALDGFDATLHPAAADLDFALCAAALGLRTECEPTSLIVGDSARAIGDDGSLSAGRSLERVFRRHQHGQRSAHYLRCLSELAYALVEPQWSMHAVGRSLGWLTSLFESTPAARIETAKERLAAASEPEILQLPRRGMTSERRRAA